MLEDDAQTASVLKNFFEEHCGHEVTICKSSDAGFHTIITSVTPYDVIVLDYHLNGPTGLDFFCKLLSSEHKDVPVVMLTAEDSQSVLIEFLKMGGADFVQKPIQDLFLIEGMVRHSVAIRRHKNELEKINAEKAAALNSKKMMEEFLAKVGHELGTPLHHMKSAINICLREISNGNQQKTVEWLTLAKNSNLRMSRIVNDISDMSRLQLGKLLLKKRCENFRKIIETACHEVHQMLKDEELSGTIEIQASVPNVNVICDPERLTQVFLNLLNNAVHHAQGRKQILIEGGIEKDRLYCLVKDDGIGMCPEKVGKIFEPFEQCGTAYNSSGNLGIGLTITREILRLHGGDVIAYPNEPQGMVFETLIPIEEGIYDAARR